MLTLNDIIHPEVRKIYPGADVPVFEFDSSGDALIMRYKSPRRMCAFAIGLIEGAAAHYREEVACEHSACMNSGDEQCVLRISFKEQQI